MCDDSESSVLSDADFVPSRGGNKRRRGRPAVPSTIKPRLKCSARLQAKKVKGTGKSTDESISKEICGPSPDMFPSSQNFSKEEMVIVLEALNKFGTNLPEIQKMLPKRNVDEIAMFLFSRGRKAKMIDLAEESRFKNRLKTLKRVNGWIASLTQTQSCYYREELSLALQSIADLEKHPPPELCEGIDFKKMYHFLSQIVSGEPPSEMSAENMALLAGSLTMVQNHKTELPFTSALHKVVAGLKSIDITNALITKPKTYSRKDMEDEHDKPQENVKFNPLKINADLLALEPENINKLPLINEFTLKIPTVREEKITFQENGLPVEKDLVFNALRAKERPIFTGFRCTGEDVYIKLPSVTSENLKKVHFSSKDAYPRPLPTISIAVGGEAASLVSSLVPGSMVDKKCTPDESTHVISIENPWSFRAKPVLVHKPSLDTNVSDIQYFPKPTVGISYYKQFGLEGNFGETDSEESNEDESQA